MVCSRSRSIRKKAVLKVGGGRLMRIRGFILVYIICSETDLLIFIILVNFRIIWAYFTNKRLA